MTSDPETEVGKTHNNPIPIEATEDGPDPVQELHKPCDPDITKLETPVGSRAQLSSSVQPAPDGPEPPGREETLFPHVERDNQAGHLERGDTGHTDP